MSDTSGNFTLREPVIEQKTSVGVAVGVSIAFAFLYMLICLSCMVRRLQLNKSSWTSAASVSQIQVRPSMGNTDGVSLGAGQPSFFARSGSVWSHRSSADGISMQHRNSDMWIHGNGTVRSAQGVAGSARSRVSHINASSPVMSHHNLDGHQFVS